jgi:selenocysteine lyase/cysteine desulfurase
MECEKQLVRQYNRRKEGAMELLPPQRHLFDIPEEIAYFNCAYNSPQLKATRAALQRGADSKSEPWKRTVASFFDDADTLRTLAANLFGGDADGYAVIPAASYGLSTAARAVEPRLRPGDRILVVADEFPSGVLPWMKTARETGAVLTTVPTPTSGGWAEAILHCLTDEIKVVALSTCHWTSGALIDLDPVSTWCRELGCMLVVDATQSLGAMPFPMDEIQPDFLVAAGYKWLLCPYGFGLMYVSERWRNARPLEETWISRDNARDFTTLAEYSEGYLPGARRFDVGETCVPTTLPGAIKALEQIGEWGIDRIAATLAEKNRRICVALEGLGFALPSPAERCPHLFGAQMPAGCATDPVGKLKQKGIFVSRRGNSIRIAPHVFIDEHDIARLVSGLEELVHGNNPKTQGAAWIG